MVNKLLILCQGLHKSKIIASFLSYSPKDCLILRSFYDINNVVREKIDTTISNVVQYISTNLLFFQQLERIWEVKIDIINPLSVIRSLETIDIGTQFHDYEFEIDISAGPIPANVGLYLFALKYKIPSVHFSFPGERFQLQDSNLSKLQQLQLDIEFAKKYSYDIPISDVLLKDIDDEILFELAKTPDQGVDSLKKLSSALDREDSSKTMMNLSRECSRLAALNLIKTTKLRKEKKISLTSFGKQYSLAENYDKPQLKLIWERNQ